MGRQPLLTAIQHSKQSIHLIMYGFTDKTLLAALLEQKQRGRSLKMILERSPYKAESENTETIRALNQHDVSWQGSVPSFRLIHQKTLITDGSQAIIMTFNFTNSSFKEHTAHPTRNFAVVIDDPQTVKAVEAVFTADWNHTPIDPSASMLIYSPNNSRHKLLDLIDHAHHQIKIYAQHITDYKIIGALANAAKRGVNVEILTSRMPREKQLNYLLKAGVKLHESKRYYIHAKAMVIDDETAVIGSINFTRASLDDNRELSFITRDQRVIKPLTATFNQDVKELAVIPGKAGTHAFNIWHKRLKKTNAALIDTLVKPLRARQVQI